MFFWGLRIRKPFKEQFKVFNGENTIQKHLSLLSNFQLWKNFGQQPLLSKRLRKGSIYGVPMHLASPPIAFPEFPMKWCFWTHSFVNLGKCGNTSMLKSILRHWRTRRGTFQILLVWSNELIYHSKNRNTKGASPTILQKTTRLG